jgi:hypothetical protein
VQAVIDAFSHHELDDGQRSRVAAIREAFMLTAHAVIANVPVSADRTAVLCKLREAMMMANAAIALGGRAP